MLELGGAQVRGRSASPVELDHGPRRIHDLRKPVDFPFQLFEIGDRHLVVPVDDDVAAAEEAQTFAEGKMHVQRKRPRGPGFIRLLQRLLEIGRAEGVQPLRRCRIARIAGAGDVVPVQYFPRDIQRFALDLNI